MPDEMSYADFTKALDTLGLDAAAAGLAIGSDEATIRRWRRGARGIPGPVAVLVRLWLRVQKDRAIPTVIKLRILPATGE